MKEGSGGERHASKKQIFIECLLCTIYYGGHFLIPWCSRLCWFPLAAVMNDHERSGLNGRNLVLHGYRGQKSEISVSRAEVRVSAEPHSLWRLWGRGLVSPSFQLLMDASVPWLSPYPCPLCLFSPMAFSSSVCQISLSLSLRCN